MQVKFPNVKVIHVYDPTLTLLHGPPRTNEKVLFYDIGIGSSSDTVNGMKLDTLENLLRKHEIKKGSRKLLKMDVEGYEFEALSATSEEVIREFDHITMEIHCLSADFPERYNPIKALQKHFYLYHVHFHNSANNGKYDVVFEASWIRKDLAKQV